MLIECPQLKDSACSESRAEIRQGPGKQRRWRMGGHHDAGATVFHFSDEPEQRALPLDLSHDLLEIVDAQAIELTQPLEHLDAQASELPQR